MWTQGVDAASLCILFNHFTRTGYPTGPHGVAPFKTKSVEVAAETTLLRDVEGKIKLRRHVRPLYKTFMIGFQMWEDKYCDADYKGCAGVD
jgi:hypothetical protein